MGRLRSRLALRRPYRYRYRRWVRVDGGRVPSRAWLGDRTFRVRFGFAPLLKYCDPASVMLQPVLTSFSNLRLPCQGSGKVG